MMSKIKILFVVPYPGLLEMVNRVLENFLQKEKIEVEVKHTTVDRMPEISDKEYDAIVARGYSATKTEKKYSNKIPTIRMHVSGYDIIKALIECREKYNPKKVAICGFSEVLYEAANICNIIGVNANVYNPVNNADLAKAVNNALHDGCDAIVGGYSINLIAQKMGINSVVVKSGQESIAQAMNEAIFTVERIRQERIKAQMYKTIIYSTDSGLLYVNTNGVIQVANHAVRHITGCDNLKDKVLKEEIPWLYELYEEVICSEKHGSRLILVPHTKMMVSVKCTPVVANKEISGTVINIKDVTQIQELEKQIRKELSEKGLNTRYRFEDIIHQSRTIDRVIEQARKYAVSDSNVIILGETGTGKEIFAQSIHNVSNRKNGPFVAINCAALPENLLESELFGYVDGAFTGANKGGKIGLFEMAHKGTLFIDEIGEISPAIQIKLLRVLQEKEVRRIGADKVSKVDVRIITATNKSIQKLAESGQFRRDLLYRLDVLRLFLPPLRERENDAELIFMHYLRQIEHQNNEKEVDVDEDALKLLNDYPFLGNIRELRNIAERVSVLHECKHITKRDLEEALYPNDLDDKAGIGNHVNISGTSGYLKNSNDKVSDKTRNKEDEIEQIYLALEASHGNRNEAARMLSMDRTTLWRKMKKHGIM